MEEIILTQVEIFILENQLSKSYGFRKFSILQKLKRLKQKLEEQKNE